MSDIKIVGWPKRPAEQRRDELEIENAELRKSLSDRESELDITMAEQEQLIDEIAELRKLVEQMLEALEACAAYWYYKRSPSIPEQSELISLGAEQAQRLIKAAIAAAKGNK